jgi:hypothetical protein
MSWAGSVPLQSGVSAGALRFFKEESACYSAVTRDKPSFVETPSRLAVFKPR